MEDFTEYITILKINEKGGKGSGYVRGWRVVNGGGRD